MLSLILAMAMTPPAEAPEDISSVALGADGSRRMTVQVRVHDSAPLPFVIDTGAERTVISRQLADRLNLQKGPVRNLVTVTGSGKVNTVIVPHLELSGTKVKEIEAPALDRAHIGAPGMLGIDALKSRRVTIDFRKNEMRVTPARQVEDVDPDTIVVSAKSKFGQLILVDSRFMGERVRVIVDTGAQTSIGNLALLHRLQRRNKIGPLRAVTLSGVTGETVSAQFATVDRIQIGGADFSNIPVAFTDAEPFKRFGLANQPALLLGMDALRLFDRVSVDFANKQVRFMLPDGAALGARVLLASR
ncbi:retroviral-like aspartic protease family protein [Sphingomonas sp.]|jgi:predicted aspartyl protease|uniref:retroviral-like aspartic protease family protein n=1 Tax=Sphingomonas sp. TaxID=28214 RepID=UPI002DEF9707|nr:retroviral-like aspartic protease family protein [Sphingomonas sp.]